jgi:DnaJ-class molecular chaperone
MRYKFKAKKKIQCKECKGFGCYSFKNDNNLESTVEYYCNECDGQGEVWEEVQIPLESLKELLK